MTERYQVIEEHPILELPEGQIPESLRVLFEQANLCYLFDLDIACVGICGSLVEEALEARFPVLAAEWHRKQREERRSVSWRDKRDQVLAAYPHFGKISRSAGDVVWDRNLALHDPSSFLKEKAGQQEQTLRKTRAVLENLFEIQS